MQNWPLIGFVHRHILCLFRWFPLSGHQKWFLSSIKSFFSHTKHFTLVIFLIFTHSYASITQSTRSSSFVRLVRLTNRSRLKITDRSFYHTAPALWKSFHIFWSSTALSKLFYYCISICYVSWCVLRETQNLAFPLVFSSLVTLLPRPLGRVCPVYWPGYELISSLFIWTC